MKKLLLLVISLVMVLSMAMFTGCNGDSGSNVASCDIIFYMAEVDASGRELASLGDDYYDDYTNFTEIMTIKKGKAIGNVKSKVQKELNKVAGELNKAATIKNWTVIEDTWEVEEGQKQVVLVRVGVALISIDY